MSESNAHLEKWAETERTYGAEVTKALRALYDYYDGEGIANWIAGLFDGDIGGFYYSNSARDTEGYLPDLESTAQALTVLAEIGAIPTDKLNAMISSEVRERIIGFVRDCQSAVDGYYYHPQWPQGRDNLPTDRYGRDLGNAASVLRRVRYGEGTSESDIPYPKYCTGDGKKCKRHAGTSESCVFPIGNASFPKVPEKEERTDSAPKPVGPKNPVYTSREDFRAWLEEFSGDILKASGRAHNLAAIVGEIIRNGYGDDLIDYLDEMQRKLFDEQTALGETPTGIWQRDINYKAVWGMYKYAYIYNNVGRPIELKYVPYMIDTALEVIKLPPLKNYAYNDLMNQWSAINAVVSNVRCHHGDEIANKLYERVRENAPALIENSLAKMLPFKMSDGSFCNNVKGVTTPVIYGVPIAVGDIAEGNVNSTHILLCMYFSICSALGCPAVALCDTTVGERVARKLYESIKN